MSEVTVPTGYRLIWQGPENIPAGWKVIPWSDIDQDIDYTKQTEGFMEIPSQGDPLIVPLFDESGQPIYVVIEKL